ncbi:MULTISPECIES: hypothetical protein [unclassified Pseudoalteromonas]|uniref:hypothetical protein n=1 Tax=unclassified Pseudoalteromonas TaxID=194690 RepID=UPI0005A7EB3E|nr:MULTISPECIES: hypothetical protein [unclassified Pseudoalteromonas]
MKKITFISLVVFFLFQLSVDLLSITSSGYMFFGDSVLLNVYLKYLFVIGILIGNFLCRCLDVNNKN